MATNLGVTTMKKLLLALTLLPFLATAGEKINEQIDHFFKNK